MSYEFTPKINLPVYKTTGELALEAELEAFDTNTFDAAMIRFGYGEQPDLSDEIMTEARAVYGVGGNQPPETFTSVYDTWVDLANEKIGEYNFTVETTDETTQYTEGSANDFELDFENGRIKVLSTGTMTDATDYQITYSYNKGQRLISGLTAATEYYYRGYLQPIMFGSSAMMNTAVNSIGFMNDLANSATAMTEVANSATAMTEVANSATAMTEVANSAIAMTEVANSATAMTEVANSATAMTEAVATTIGRTGFLLSPYAVSSIWSSQIASEQFWDIGTNITTSAPLGQDYFVNSNTGYGLRFSGELNSNTGYGEVSVDLDLTDVDLINIPLNWSTYGGSVSITITAKGTTDTTDTTSLFSNSSNSYNNEATMDVSSHTGEFTLKIKCQTGSPTGAFPVYYRIARIVLS